MTVKGLKKHNFKSLANFDPFLTLANKTKQETAIEMKQKILAEKNEFYLRKEEKEDEDEDEEKKAEGEKPEAEGIVVEE